MDALTTEMADPRYSDLDLWTTAQMVSAMNEAEADVSSAVGRAHAQITSAIDAISAGLARGGRLIYVGAGTPGRLGVLDASECPPTFSTDPGMVRGLIAGGSLALTSAVEGAEDDYQAGYEEVLALNVTGNDAVVGITASGRTPYVLGAIAAATDCGAVTGGISCNQGAELSARVDHPIEAVVGPEIIAGSTRLKAGSAQKQILNMISTLSMVKIGKTYGNLMVDVSASNQKLQVRAQNLVMRIAGVDVERATAALAACDGDVKTAIVCIMRDVEPLRARDILAASGGVLRAVTTS
ncbi:N-acetylmuramic acid 6-phosphate etherase [Tessaracoccus sp.]